jgi:hypothetical protein
LVNVWDPKYSHRNIHCCTGTNIQKLYFFGGIRVTRSLVLYVCFVDRCLSFYPFFCHFVVCSSVLWYLQALLINTRYNRDQGEVYNSMW